MTSKRRILSIDGGGILGTFPAAFLAELEKHLEKPIGCYFDLIVGTSTGGIIAIALGLGHSASEILNFYTEYGPKIFGRNRFIRGVRQFFRPKHDSDALRRAVINTIGEKRIGDSRARLVIPAWNPQIKSVYVYKTAHHKRFKTDYKSLAVDAAMATSAAPTFLPQHITKQGASLIDGGVWANNPSGIAVVEAIAVLGWRPESIHMLSVGCLDETYTIHKQSGFGRIGLKAIRLFMDGQSLGAIGMTKLLLGDEHDRKALHRVNQTVPRNTYKMDDAKIIQDLTGLGHAKGRDRIPVLECTFFDSPAEKFVPCYTLGEENHAN